MLLIVVHLTTSLCSQLLVRIRKNYASPMVHTKRENYSIGHVIVCLHFKLLVQSQIFPRSTVECIWDCINLIALCSRGKGNLNFFINMFEKHHFRTNSYIMNAMMLMCCKNLNMVVYCLGRDHTD